MAMLVLSNASEIKIGGRRPVAVDVDLYDAVATLRTAGADGDMKA